MAQHANDNYVYLKYYNYLRDGNDPSAIFQATKEHIKLNIAEKRIMDTVNNAANQDSRKEIEQALNWFYDTDPNKQAPPNLESFTKEMRAEVIKKLEQKTGKVITENLTGGTPGSYGASSEDLAGPIAPIAELETRIESVEKRVNILIQTLENVAQRCSGDNGKKEEIERDIQQLKQYLYAVKSAVGDQAALSNLINFYNSLLPKILVFNKKATGDIAESISAIMLGAMGDSTKTITQNIEEWVDSVFNANGQSAAKVVGGQTSKKAAVSNIDDIDKNMIGKKQQQIVFNSNGRYFYYYANKNPSQNKVDITFQLNRGTLATASLKNYNLSSSRGAKKKGMSIVSGTKPLLLVGNQSSFLSHFLNVTAQHFYSDEDVGKNPKNPRQKLFIDAHDTMKLLMFANGIAGGQFYFDENNNYRQTGIADYFIVHDNSKKQWRVYWTQDIIATMVAKYLAQTQAEKMLNDITQRASEKDKGVALEVKGYPAYVKPPTYTISGDWKKMDALERIDRIYKAFNKKKISIKMNVHILQSTYKLYE